jgi:hypothetical protein
MAARQYTLQPTEQQLNQTAKAIPQGNHLGGYVERIGRQHQVVRGRAPTAAPAEREFSRARMVDAYAALYDDLLSGRT